MLIGYILLLIALAEIVLGLFLITRYERNQATFWYGLFAMAVAVYVGANGAGYTGLLPGRWAEHLAWVGGMSTAFFFLPFSFYYPLPRKRNDALIPLTAWPIVVFTAGLLWTDAFVSQQGIVRFGQGYTTNTGPYFWFMIAVFATYWIWGIWNLITWRKQSDGLHRRNLNLILAGILSSLIVSTIFDVYMPLTHVTRYGYIGSLFSAIWLGFTSYIILRK